MRGNVTISGSIALLAIGLGVLAGCADRRETAHMTVTAPSEPPLALPVSGFDPLDPLDEGFMPATETSSMATGSLVQHTLTDEGADFDPCITPDRKWLIFASTRHAEAPSLYRQQVDGVAVTQLTDDPGAEVQPCVSPDGAQIAFASNRGGSWDIWIIGLDGGAPVQITDGRGDELHPTWSPDGSRLAYCERRNGGAWQICVTDARAGGAKRCLADGLFPTWSPQGDRLAFQRPRGRGAHGFGIWTIELIDDEPRRPTEIASSGAVSFIAPCWSPDGAWLSFVAVTPGSVGTLSSETGIVARHSPTAELWMVELTGRRRALTMGEAGYGPAWSGDGRIYFSANRDGAETIWSILPGGMDPTAPAVPTEAAQAAAETAVSPG